MKIENNRQFTFVRLSETQSRNAQIFGLIKKKTSISRSEITKETGINAPSISHYIKAYLDKRLVTETGHEASTGGRPPELIKLNNEKRLLGVAVLRNLIKIAITDLNIKKLSSVERPLASAKPREIQRQLLRELDDVIKDARTGPELLAAGIGIEDGGIKGSAESIHKRFGIEAFEGPAASAGSYAESLANDAACAGTVLYIYSDLGGGAVVKGAEIIGCLESGSERYLNPWHKMLGIEETARRITARGVGTLIVDMVKGDPARITNDIVAEAAGKNDDVAHGIIKTVSMNLGTRAAYLVNIFAPDVVVVGMSSSRISSLMIDGIKEAVGMFSLKDLRGKVKIIPGHLEDDAVSLGSAALAAREIFVKL